MKLMKVCRLEVVHNHDSARKQKQRNHSKFVQERLDLVGQIKAPTLCAYDMVDLLDT